MLCNSCSNNISGYRVHSLVEGCNYLDLKVTELKEQLGKRWLPTGGLECILQARLRRALRREHEVRYCNAIYDCMRVFLCLLKSRPARLH